jgi:hypothetical protein
MLGCVGIRDGIFPAEHREDLVQTEWAQGWIPGSIGFEEAARFLTEHRSRFGASIDQVGLVIFYLQRHRVELALKELLVARGVDLAEVKAPHSLHALWAACSKAVGVSSEEWRGLNAAGGELVTLLHERDPASHTFRYPVDRHGKVHERPAYIDLQALEKHVDDLVYGVRGYMDYVEESEREARGYAAEMEREAEY